MSPPRSRAKCADVQGVLDTRVTLVPISKSKVVHLIRHAQGFHNVAGEKDRDAYRDPAYEDAHLTDAGWQQVDALHAHLEKLKEHLDIQLIVVSPLTRTMETAAGSFGSIINPDQTDPKRSLFMAGTVFEEGKSTKRPAVSSNGCPPIVACELCREQLGRNPCDKRRNIAELKVMFPAVDFSQVSTDSDSQWESYGKDSRESVAEIQGRAVKFLEWLKCRPETRIAVVSHSAFLTLGLLPLFNGLPSYDAALSDSMGEYFQNCEMRSYTMACTESASGGGDAPPSKHPWAFPGGKAVLDSLAVIS